MSTDTNQKYRDAFTRLFAPDCTSTATALVNAMLDQTVVYSATIPLDPAGTTTTTHTADTSTLVALKATSFKVITHTNVTADNTNYAIMQLVYNNGNGGTDTIVAQANTSIPGAALATNNITALIAYSATINSTNQQIPAGSQIQFKITKTATTGLSMPVSSFEFKATAV